MYATAAAATTGAGGVGREGRLAGFAPTSLPGAGVSDLRFAAEVGTGSLEDAATAGGRLPAFSDWGVVWPRRAAPAGITQRAFCFCIF